MISGYLGWVLIPDKKTISLSQSLARTLTSSADYFVKKAHISLYHGNFENIPESLIKDSLRRLKNLIGEKYYLNNISNYANSFLFWDLKKPYPQIQKAHEYIVKSYSGLVKKGTKKYPLINKLYRPHITLIYNGGGIDIKTQKSCQFSITKAQLVKLGDFGTIAKTLYTT